MSQHERRLQSQNNDQTSSRFPCIWATDDHVAAGQTYYYVVTTVNSDLEESVYSNQASAVIPSLDKPMICRRENVKAQGPKWTCHSSHLVESI